MATKKVNAASPLPIDPHELPADGTPVTFSQTFQRHVGSSKPAEDDRIPTADDFEDAEWEVRRQTPDGWEFLERVEGMPLDNELRDNYGAGKYELNPVDPRTGKVIKQVRKVRLISATISPASSGSVLPFPNMRDEYAQPPQFGPVGGDEMPAWMRWQMQQAATEQAEQRRRAEEAMQRQRDFEEKLALREFERQEREERERKRRDDLAADEARRRDERFSQMLTAGLGLAQAFISTQRQPKQERDVNEVLLRELMEERRSRTPQANGMRDSLELLMVLDKLAESRASRESRGRDDDDDGDDTMKQLLVGMLPAMLNRGGGGGGGAPQMSPDMIDQMVDQALNDPRVIEKVALRNPHGIAKTFMKAVKQNPALEKAVLEAVEKASEDDEE